MKTLVLSACAAALVATAALPASAGQFTMKDDGPSGAIIAAGDNRYYDNQGYDQGYRDYGYGQGNGYGYGQGNVYGQGNGYGYGNGGYRYSYYRVVPPHEIVRRLHWSGFSQISRPQLAGQHYQIKARNPNGRKVKLWVDAYSGQIVRVKKK